MASHCRRRGPSAKLQLKFVGPYRIAEALPNHTHKVERSGQVAVQNEACLKPYGASPDAVGEAFLLLESRRQPVARGQVRRGAKIVVLRPVVRAREPRCRPQPAEKLVALDQASHCHHLG